METQDPYEQINELLQKAGSIPDGPARTAIVKECVRIADTTGDEFCMFQVRGIFIECAFHSGEADEMIVALSWCMGAFDKDPELFEDPEMIIGLMSHALGYVTDFPSIQREKIVSMLDDFERRHREAGMGLGSVYLERTRNGFWMGDLEESRVNYKKFLSCAQEDGWGEDSARIFRTDFHVQMSDHEAACREAEPVVNSDRPADEVSHWVMCFVLASLVNLNRLEDAKSCHERGYRVCRANPKYLGLVSLHMNYLSAVNELPKALALFERHVGWVENSCSFEKRMRFFAASWKLFHELRQNGTEHVSLTLPDNLGPSSMNGQYNTDELAKWFEAEARKFAKLFDDRNGNQFITSVIEDMFALKSPQQS